MATFNRLSDEKMASLSNGRQRQIDLSIYTDWLKALNVGDWSRVTLFGDEQSRTIKRRITIAAHELGIGAKWRKTREPNKLLFRVMPEPQRPAWRKSSQ